MTTDEEVDVAVMEPPVDTRAYLRGRCISSTPTRSPHGAAWDSLSMINAGAVDCSAYRCASLFRGTKEHVEELLLGSEDAASLVARLRS